MSLNDHERSSLYSLPSLSMPSKNFTTEKPKYYLLVRNSKKKVSMNMNEMICSWGCMTLENSMDVVCAAVMKAPSSSGGDRSP